MPAHDVTVQTSDAQLEGQLAMFSGATAVVAFAHGSGSSRHSPRNKAVADELNRSGSATLLFDLLTAQEERVDNVTAQQRFDIDLLTARLTGAVHWLADNKDTEETPIGLFGASTGAAAALRTAAERPAVGQAVVPRGGRHHLGGAPALEVVHAPAMSTVGQPDCAVLAMNEQAAARLRGPNRIHLLPRPPHLFEQLG